MDLKIKKIKENAIVPTRATEGSAGFDLYACINEPITIKRGERTIIPTGIAVEISDKNYAIFIFARSGLGIKYGISLSNGVGVIDSDYRGEICVGLINTSNVDYVINPSDRIAQMILMPICLPDIILSDELNTTDRNLGGFGSTGK